VIYRSLLSMFWALLLSSCVLSCGGGRASAPSDTSGAGGRGDGGGSAGRDAGEDVSWRDILGLGVDLSDSAFQDLCAKASAREAGIPPGLEGGMDSGDEPDGGAILIPAYAPRRGPASARVTMVEFGDFECPYCGAVEPTVKQVLATYPNDVALVFLNLPLSIHPYALHAAEAFLAAACQGKAWEMHDQMFAHQQALSDVDLDEYAQVIGLDVVQFDADRSSPEIANEVAQDEALASSLGVEATPTFNLNGFWVVGDQPYSTFQQVIDQELAVPVPDAAVDSQ